MAVLVCPAAQITTNDWVLSGAVAGTAIVTVSLARVRGPSTTCVGEAAQPSHVAA